MATDGPLAGLRVIELCTFVAGPLAGMLLAQQGADVIRVDPLGGAPDVRRLPRSPGGTSLYWTGLNKHKRSVEADLRSSAGRDLVCGLVAAGDDEGGILLTNAVGAAWLDIDRLREYRADVIKIHIQGHADGRPAVDYTVNAASGFPLVTGPSGWEEPVNHALPAWDVITGSLAVSGLLAAERRRLLGGTGELVEIALSDVALAVSGHLGYLAEAETLARDRPRTGNDIYGTFGTAFATADDHRVMVAAITRRQWRDLMEATGLASVVAQVAQALGADFDEEADRYAARESIAAVLRPWFAARTLEEIAEAFRGHAVLWDRYRSFREVVAEHRRDPSASGILQEVFQPGVGGYLAPGSPLRFAEHPSAPAAPAPEIGQHTEEVVRDLLGPDAYPELVAAGAVRPPEEGST